MNLIDHKSENYIEKRWGVQFHICLFICIGPGYFYVWSLLKTIEGGKRWGVQFHMVGSSAGLSTTARVKRLLSILWFSPNFPPSLTWQLGEKVFFAVLWPFVIFWSGGPYFTISPSKSENLDCVLWSNVFFHKLMVVKPLHILLLFTYYSAATAAKKPDSGNPHHN